MNLVKDVPGIKSGNISDHLIPDHHDTIKTKSLLDFFFFYQIKQKFTEFNFFHLKVTFGEAGCHCSLN